MGWLQRLFGGTPAGTDKVTPTAGASGGVASFETICPNPGCGVRLQLPNEYEGKKGRCKKCGIVFLMTQGKGKLLSPSHDQRDITSIANEKDGDRGKHVICAVVLFHVPGPSSAEQRQEMLKAFGTVRNHYGLTAPDGLRMMTETQHIADVHDHTEICAMMEDALKELGLVGSIQAIGLETDNPRFSKVQVAWATEAIAEVIYKWQNKMGQGSQAVREVAVDSDGVTLYLSKPTPDGDTELTLPIREVDRFATVAASTPAARDGRFVAVLKQHPRFGTRRIELDGLPESVCRDLESHVGASAVRTAPDELNDGQS